jgi:hypothetical protein
MSTAEVTSSTAGSTASAGLTAAAKARGTSQAAALAGAQATLRILAAGGSTNNSSIARNFAFEKINL